VKRIFTLDVVAPIIFYAILVGSIYLLFAGHNQPGGGFVGGLVAGAAVALRYIAGGLDEVRHISPFRPWTILGAGLVTAATVALVPVLLGDPVLDSAYVTLDLPLLGTVALVSAALFDLGVYLVVVGLVLMVFEAFGQSFDRPDPLAYTPPEPDPAPAPAPTEESGR
jgi:multisubunit Na+/H+ antiporter MnhB subunit